MTRARRAYHPRSGFVIADFSLAVADAIGQIRRDSVPDLRDRVIAATAVALKATLVSRDRKIRAADLTTIW
jgi:predicted nucleic acid-binding protein